jgi:peptidoglycan lytic transglycosylase D
MEETRSNTAGHGPQRRRSSLRAASTFLTGASRLPAFSLTALLTLAGCATALQPSPPPEAVAHNGATAPAVPPPAQTGVNPTAPAATPPEDGQPQTRLQNPELYPDIWARIRAGFSMPKLDSPLVAVHEKWFANNPDYMQRMMERSRLYLYHIVQEVEKRGLPTELALLPAIESGYQPYAHSRARAVGLWQFIAPTGRLYGLRMNWWYDGRRDVEASTQAALDYLEKLYNDFDGDWDLALAAYNAGEGKISRMMDYNRAHGRPTDYQSLRLRRETVNYVPKLQAMVNIIANPEKYGVKLAEIPNKPYFTRVDTGSQVDLGVVAKLTDMPVTDLQVINPGFTRWATDPNGPHYVLVPVDKKDALVEGLANLPDEQRVRWRGHQVRRGETLSDIARHYGVAVETIRSSNRLTSNLIRTGQNLLIPVSLRPLPPVVNAQTVRATQAAPSSGMPYVIHQVRAGETLSSIARRYNVLVRQLAKWNLMSVTDVLRLGQRLRIWTSGEPSASLDDATPKKG